MEVLVYQQVLKKLITSCVVLRAKRTIPSVRAAFQGTSGELLANFLAPLNVIEQQINETQPVRLNSAFLFE